MPDKPSKATRSKKAPAKTKTKSVQNKTAPTGNSVRAFIDAVENETRRRDAKTALAMMKKITGEKPTMWGSSIIGFGTYHYRYDSGREGDFLNVGFSPRKANLVFYVMGCLGENEPLLKSLGKHKLGRACLYVNTLADIDIDILAQIIDKSYRRTREKYA